MALFDALDKLAGYFQPAVNASCLSAKEMAAVRLAARVAYPDQTEWHSLQYPGEMSLPILLLPLPPELSPPIRAAVTVLHQDIQKEGFHHSQFQISSRYEHRQAHFWFAKLSRNQFLPIGQLCFVLEDRREKGAGQAADSPPRSGLYLKPRRSGIIVRRWWMQFAWLRPAYRCQRIFRHTMPYLQKWHPDFLVRDPNPPLARSLKDFPQHIFDGRVQWWDGTHSGHE